MVRRTVDALAAAVILLLSLASAYAQQPSPNVVSQEAFLLPSQIVQGAHVNIVAQWNETKDAVGVYQAPIGFVIKAATPVVNSELRSSSSVEVSADRREARLRVQVRGKGEFWNKERGWFDGHLNIELAQP